MEFRSIDPRRLAGPASSSIASHRNVIAPTTALTAHSSARSRSRVSRATLLPLPQLIAALLYQSTSTIDRKTEPR